MYTKTLLSRIFAFKRATLMRAVIQRVAQASVTIGGLEKSAIGPGLLILLGIEESDDASDGYWIARTMTPMRWFQR